MVKYIKSVKGFTLIELMIVVAIIGILAAIAIPAFQKYINSAADKACLYEAKAYSNRVFNSLFDQDDSTSPPSPIISSCKSITDASSWTFNTPTMTIIAISKGKNSSTITCDLLKGGSCSISP